MSYRELILKRENRFSGSLAPIDINIDGKWVAKLKNGAEISIPLDYSQHEFYMRYGDTAGSKLYSDKYIIPQDQFNHRIFCHLKWGLFQGKLLWEVDQEQEEKNRHMIQMANKMNEALVSIEKESPIGYRDYSELDNLPKEVLESGVYEAWYTLKKFKYPPIVVEQYMKGNWGYERLYRHVHDLYTITALKDEYSKYLRHYDYFVKSHDAINSVLDEENAIDEIIQFFDENAYDYISEELINSIDNIENYYNDSDIWKTLETLLFVDVDESALINLKKALIIASKVEGISDEETKKYKAVKNLYKKVFLFIEDCEQEKVHVITVDEIIAETIRNSYTKSFTELDKMLDNFLEYTCKLFKIDGSQFNILQKVFAFYGAYDLEKKILENMVKNYIPRNYEQEDRLVFLQEGKYKLNNFVDNDSQPNNFIEDNSIKYEYRSVNWNSEKIEEYCENLSLQNRVVQYPIVVQEWNKEVTIDTNYLDVETIKQLMVNEFIDNYGKCFSVCLGMSRTIDNYSEAMDTIFITADGDEQTKNVYSWITYFVTAEKINNKQVAFAIYVLYVPTLDTEVNSELNSIIEKNKLCAKKVILLKEKQNPRINRQIQNVNNLIIKVLENWANDENKKVDIYS